MVKQVARETVVDSGTRPIARREMVNVAPLLGFWPWDHAWDMGRATNGAGRTKLQAEGPLIAMSPRHARAHVSRKRCAAYGTRSACDMRKGDEQRDKQSLRMCTRR